MKKWLTRGPFVLRHTQRALLVSCCLLLMVEIVAAQTPGVTDQTITVGTTTVLSGTSRFWGQGIIIGMRTHFNAINVAGGVHGRRIQLRAYDDQFHPPYAQANVQRLIEQDHAFALVAVSGTATNDAIRDVVHHSGIPNVALLSHAHHFLAPVTPTHFTLLPSYRQQAIVLVDYLVKRRKITQGIAVIYENNAFGNEVLQGIQDRLQQYALALVAAENFQRGTFNLLPQVAALRQAQAQAVIVATAPRILPGIFAEASAMQYTPQWFGLSNLYRRETAELADLNAPDLVVLTPFPDPLDETPALQEFRRVLDRFYPGHIAQEPEFYGYATAKVVAEAFQRAGRALTRERFLAALETLRGFDAGTLPPVTFSATRHHGSTALRVVRPVLTRWYSVAGFQDLHQPAPPLIADRVVAEQPKQREPATGRISPELLQRRPVAPTLPKPHISDD